VTNSVHHHLLAEDCTPTGSRDLDDNESIRVTTVPLESLLGDALAGRIRDGRALTCLLYYAGTRGIDAGAAGAGSDAGDGSG
jgi:ADP-ribose pyrophosphatase